MLELHTFGASMAAIIVAAAFADMPLVLLLLQRLTAARSMAGPGSYSSV